MNRRDPLRCILPPYVLRGIHARSSAVRQQDILTSIAGTARLRAHRRAVAIGPRGPRAVAQVSRKLRRVFTAENGTSLPGRLVRQEGDPALDDPAVNEAYDGAGHTYDLFRQAYERDSLDGAGMYLDSTVHYGRSYDNAFWDGGQLVYGDGDGVLFNRFTVAVEVIGHEFTHAVVQYTCNLGYSGQPGALGESLSDVFGSLVKQRRNGQSANEADWLVGEGLFTSRVNGSALRSLKEPGNAYDDPVLGKDPQPGHMRDYVATLEDNGGVHINSGIPNHAFFLAAVAMGGRAWERAGRIWYVALRDHMRSSTDFQGAADVTFRVAGDLYGPSSAEQEAVKYAWESVGLKIGAQPRSLPAPAGCVAAPLTAFRAILGRKAEG